MAINETDLKVEEKITDRGWLFHYYNMFSQKKIAHLLDLGHYERLLKEDPNGQILQNEGGQLKKVSISEIINSTRKSLKAAISHCENIERLLDLEGKGQLATQWSEGVLNPPKSVILTPEVPTIGEISAETKSILEK